MNISTPRMEDKTGPFNNEVWHNIVSHSSPTTIRVTSIVNRSLYGIVNLFKIMLVNDNKELCFFLDSEQGRQKIKLFNDKLITKLSTRAISLDEKAHEVENYINTKAVIYTWEDRNFKCKLFHYFWAVNPCPDILEILLKLGTIQNASLFTDNIWTNIVSHSSPITIRALTIVNKNLSRIVKQYRIMLVLQNKDLDFEIPNLVSVPARGKTKVFDNRLIKKLEDHTFGLNKKAKAIKEYIDTKTIQSSIGEEKLLFFFSNPSTDLDIFEFLLKLGANLDIIADSYMPTALFTACNIHGRLGYLKLLELIDAGADFRIINPDGFTCFDAYRDFHPATDNTDIVLLESRAQSRWKKLKRNSSPIPSKRFSFTSRKQKKRQSCPAFNRTGLPYPSQRNRALPELTDLRIPSLVNSREISNRSPIFNPSRTISPTNSGSQSYKSSISSYYSSKSFIYNPHRTLSSISTNDPSCESLNDISSRIETPSASPTSSSDSSSSSPTFQPRSLRRIQTIIRSPTQSPTSSSDPSLNLPVLSLYNPRRTRSPISSGELAFESPIHAPHRSLRPINSIDLSHQPTVSASRGNLLQTHSSDLSHQSTVAASRSIMPPSPEDISCDTLTDPSSVTQTSDLVSGSSSNLSEEKSTGSKHG